MKRYKITTVYKASFIDYVDAESYEDAVDQSVELEHSDDEVKKQLETFDVLVTGCINSKITRAKEKVVRKFSIGDIVRIYQKPLTEEEFEGNAVLVSFISEDKITETWEVKFPNDVRFYRRKIKK